MKKFTFTTKSKRPESGASDRIKSARKRPSAPPRRPGRVGRGPGTEPSKGPVPTRTPLPAPPPQQLDLRNSPPAPPGIESVAIMWSPEQPLPRGWPAPTHVIETLPGAALPQLAARGGLAHYIARVHGPGAWVCLFVDRFARTIDREEVTVPSPRPPVQVEEDDPPHTGLLSARDWARSWALQFLDDDLTANPGPDAFDHFKEFTRVLEEHAEDVRHARFDQQIRLTEALLASVRASRSSKTGAVARKIRSAIRPGEAQTTTALPIRS